MKDREDKFGIFYEGDGDGKRAGTNPMRFHSTIGNNNDGAYIPDGRIYEDEFSSPMRTNEVTNTSHKANIAAIITKGGISELPMLSVLQIWTLHI